MAQNTQGWSRSILFVALTLIGLALSSIEDDIQRNRALGEDGLFGDDLSQKDQAMLNLSSDDEFGNRLGKRAGNTLHVGIRSKARVRQREILHLSKQIWEADRGRLNPSQYTINKKPKNGNPLFSDVDPRALKTPTFKTMRSLLDNYKQQVGKPEHVTPQHLREQEAFLEAVLQTRPMRLTWNYLKRKGLASSSKEGFIEELKQYWFKLYAYKHGVLGSSGFEHVFVGEVESTGNGLEVIGFHNWLQFYDEQRYGHLTYTKFGRTKCKPFVSKVSLRWTTPDTTGNTIPKYGTSLFMGTSPEYELAIYTLCFVGNRRRQYIQCPVQISTRRFDITVISKHTGNIPTIVTAYPRC